MPQPPPFGIQCEGVGCGRWATIKVVDSPSAFYAQGMEFVDPAEVGWTSTTTGWLCRECAGTDT